MRPEAREVLDVLGAVIYCFRKPVGEGDKNRIRASLASISTVFTHALDLHGGMLDWDGTFLAVAMPQSVTPCLEVTFDEWDDLAREYGAEYVDGEGRGRNEFGEPTGIPRVIEALSTTDWAGSDLPLHEGLLDDEDEDDETQTDNLDIFPDAIDHPNSNNPDGIAGGNGFQVEANEMGREMLGLKMAIRGLDETGSGAEGRYGDEDQDVGVEQLEGMMSRMLAVRDMSADLPVSERRKVAAKAVRDLMRTM